VFNQTKPHISIAITHEAIMLHAKSKHRPVENLSAGLHTKFEAFRVITQKLVLFLV